MRTRESLRPGARYHSPMPSEPQWRSARSRRSRERNRTYRRNMMTMIVVGAMLAPLAIASLWVLSNVQNSTAGDADIVVEIQQGWTPAQVGDTLQQQGVIESSAAFQEVAASAKFTAYAAGRYDFVENSATRQALDTLPRRAAPHRPRHQAPAPTRTLPAADRRPGRQARGQERAALHGGRAVEHHPVEVPTERRQLARGPHLARHLLHRGQRDRGRRSSRRSSPSSTPRPTRSASAERAPPTAA